MWVAVGIVFAIVAGTVSITLTITSSQISGLERSQAQQAENILALMNAQNENVLSQLRLLNDKMTSIESEHAELRSLYEKVGVLQTEMEYIRRDLDVVRANQERILKVLETLDGN